MTGRSDEDRVELLLSWYPRAWRDRYGDEFASLLIDDLAEQPHSWRRTVDVASSGLTARWSALGLGGGPLVDTRACLAAVMCGVVGFVGCGVSLWSQLATGSRLAPLNGRAEGVARLTLSVTIGYLAVVTLLAAVPVAAAIAAAVRRDGPRRFTGPALTAAASLAILGLGGRLALAAGWAATGAGTAARLGWAASVGVSAYWIHPHDLAGLPRLELAWMVVSLAAVASGLAAAVTAVRRVTLSPRALAIESATARAAAVGMIPGLAAAAWWVLSSAVGPLGVYQAGSLDVILIGAMAAALVTAGTAGRRLRTA